MRNLSSMERRVAEVSRQNRELDVMREISTSFGGERPRRPVRARLRRRRAPAPGRAPWPSSSGPAKTRRLHGARLRALAAARREVVAWARRARLDERRVDPRQRPRGARHRRRAPHPARARHAVTRSASGSRPSSCTRASFILESADPALHTPADRRLPPPIADQIALVLQDRSIRAQIEELSERNRERAETLDQILEISNDLKKNRTLDDLFQSIASAVAKSLGFQQVVLLSLYDRERNVFTPRAQFGLDDRWADLRQQDVPAEEITRHWTEGTASPGPSTCATARRAKPRPPSRPRAVVTAGDDGWRPGELLWIPLYAGDRLVGCLSVDDPKNGASPTLETIRSLEIFANQAVTAIENARSYNEAREQSIRDSLTGVYNHRHFQEMLQRELGRAERQAGR